MTSDVVIVGAGVIGSSVAFHAVSRGLGSVQVLDRGHVGSGMSSRSSALIRMHYTFAPEVELAVRSDRLFDAWPDLVGKPPCVQRTGFVRIVPPAETDSLRANVAMQQSLGARVELVDQHSLARLAPGLRTDDLHCAAWEQYGGYGDGAVVAGDLLSAARSRGARYRPATAVRRLVRRNRRVVGVETAAGVTFAGVVVLAAGVWAPELLRGIDVDLPIETEYHQVAVLRHARGAGAPVACIDSTTQTYFRPEASHSGTLVGSFEGPRGVDPDAIPPAAAPEEVADLVAAASRRVPRLLEAGIAGGVTGVYDMTPDARPLLGTVPGLDGLIVAAGFSGMGFKISPAVGESVTDLIDSRSVHGADISAFRPDRFDLNQPIIPAAQYADD